MSTISARQGQVLLRALENLGLDATGIARGAGLEEAKLEEPSARIAQEQFRLLIAAAERASDDPLVVLRAARTSGAPGILSYLALSQDTLRDGFGVYLQIPSRGVDGRFRNAFSMYNWMTPLPGHPSMGRSAPVRRQGEVTIRWCISTLDV